MVKRLLIFIVSFVIFSINITAEALPQLHFNGFISDNANVLSQKSVNYLNSILYDLQSKTKADIAVVTISSLDGDTVENTALEIGRKYKIGDKKLNNGAVILVVPNDRKMRIEVGYGLEGAITDAHAGRIMDDYMIPYFKNNNYEQGIVDGTTALAVDVAKSYNVTINAQQPNPQNTDDDSDSFLLWLVIIILLIIFRNGGFFIGGSGFGGGSGGGISFGGGGGFGGGGSSRGW